MTITFCFRYGFSTPTWTHFAGWLSEDECESHNDWAAKIKRRRHIGDFSNWNDKMSYQKAFERLLRDLKASGVST